MMSRIYVLTGMEKREKNEKSLTRLLRIIIIVLLAIIAAEVVFQFAIAPNLFVKSIIIEGNVRIAEDLIAKTIGLGDKEYFFAADTQEIRKRVEDIPGVRSAKCSKRFPDSLVISVEERAPLGCALIEEQGRSVMAVFDDQGVVFELGAGIGEYNLPVFSGLRWEGAAPGTRLPEEIVPLLASFRTIKESSKAVYDFISEVKIERRGDGFELVFITIPYSTRIRTGSNVSENMLTYGLMACDTLKKNRLESKVKELDFRSKDIVLQVSRERD